MIFRIPPPLVILLLLLLHPFVSTQAQTLPPDGDILKGLGKFEKSSVTTSDWSGVDGAGYLHVFQQSAPVVGANGRVENTPFPPYVAVADLNGDKLPDLIVSDPRGFVWYFRNSGTPSEPKFTTGEIIPIWVRLFAYEDDRYFNYFACNKICVTDFNEDKKPDIILGTLKGELFFIANTGTETSPRFVTSATYKESEVPTRTDKSLWASFFSPEVGHLTKSGARELILGEGTYSANNIYYFADEAAGGLPRFSEKTQQILIRGMGREHLTPKLVDWNNDGLPDIITGDREGNVWVYLCKSNDPKQIEFNPTPIQVQFGATRQIGALSNPVPADINGDGLFDIVCGHTNGRIAIAINHGKPGAPQFNEPIEVRGEQINSKYLAPVGWKIKAVPQQGMLYQFSLVTDQDPASLTGAEQERAQLAYEPKYSRPPGSTSKYAAKLGFLENKNKTFSTDIPITVDDTPYRIGPNDRISFKPDTNYEVSFWVKGGGWSQSYWIAHTYDQIIFTDPKTNEKTYSYAELDKKGEFTIGSSWMKVIKPFRYTRAKEITGEERKKAQTFDFSFVLEGKGTFYLSDFIITEKK